MSSSSRVGVRETSHRESGGCMEVAEGEGWREEGSTGGRARSELACGGREGGRGGTRDEGSTGGRGAQRARVCGRGIPVPGTARRAGKKAGGERVRESGRNASTGESECERAGGAEGSASVRKQAVERCVWSPGYLVSIINRCVRSLCRLPSVFNGGLGESSHEPINAP